MRLVAYYRVSTGQQGESGLGLDAQKVSVHAHARARGDEIVSEYIEVASGGRDDRELLSAALDSLRRGEADGLIVAKLDRLARNVIQVAQIMQTAKKQGWQLVALDLGVDTSTPAGELVANVLAAVAQWERRVISDRTTVALEQARARGVILGRPVEIPSEVAARIHGERAQGSTLREIAAALNAEDVPTARGGAWHASTIRTVLGRA